MTKSSADFFTQSRPIWLGNLGGWRKKLILFLIWADIRHFVFLANAEHMLKIAHAEPCELSILCRMLSIICRNKKNGILSGHLKIAQKKVKLNLC